MTWAKAWRAKDGKRVLITAMTNTHLTNTIYYLVRQYGPDKVERQIPQFQAMIEEARARKLPVADDAMGMVVVSKLKPDDLNPPPVSQVIYKVPVTSKPQRRAKFREGV